MLIILVLFRFFYIPYFVLSLFPQKDQAPFLFAPQIKPSLEWELSIHVVI